MILGGDDPEILVGDAAVLRRDTACDPTISRIDTVRDPTVSR